MKHVILVCTLAAGMAWAQSPQVVQNARTQLDTVQKNATAASNQALGIKPAAAKDAAPAAKPAAKSSAAAASPIKIVPTKVSAPATKAADPTKPKKAAASAAPKLAVKAVAAKPAPAKKAAKPAAETKKAEAAAKPAAPAAASSGNDMDSAGQSEEAKSDEDADKDKQDKKWSMSGKRDPFISPVVNHAGGSGCSTGKKCLEIGAINLRGVVHSDAGFIAVVTNSLNKAYFLRENDPVFDGYVVKITGDSIVFKETLQDRLGKTFTREVTKKITTPAV